MNGYEPYELGGLWSWGPFNGFCPASLPRAVFDRLTGGELNPNGFERSYSSRTNAIRALRRALYSKAGNRGGAE